MKTETHQARIRGPGPDTLGPRTQVEAAPPPEGSRSDTPAVWSDAWRQPVSADNPWFRAEKQLSNEVSEALDRFRDYRDQWYEGLFGLLYG